MKKLATPQEEADFYTVTNELRLVDIIHRLTQDGLAQHAMKMAEFLAHPDPGLREDALGALIAHWELPEYLGNALAMLQNDADNIVRSAAATALSEYVAWAKTPERVDEILSSIAQATSDPDDFTASRAFEALWYADAVRGGAHISVATPGPLPRAQFDQSLIKKYFG